jgi:type II secretory pathway pseudopilin PulG
MKLFKFLGRQKGFTIIEAVVATGVFAVVVSAGLGVYMATIRLDAKTRAERTVQQNARFILDFLSKEIRNGTINYAGTNNAYTLSLINQMNELEVVQWDSQTNSINLTKSGIGSTTLNSDTVRVTRLNFYLNPTTDPFTPPYTVHVQPHVTVVMRIEALGTGPNNSASIDLQTTFAVRNYPSRQP